MTEPTAAPTAAPGPPGQRPAGQPMDAPITGVTVFRDGARVLRAGQTELVAGPGSVTIGNLPAAVDTASVRVAARGTDLALRNVEVRRRVGTEPLREQAARLRAEVDRWRDAVRELDDEDAAEQAGLGFLGHLSEAAATALARAVGSGRAGYDELSGMAGHLSASTAGTLARRREIAARKRAAERELAAAEARLNAAEQGGGTPRKVAFVEVTVDLEAQAATEAEIDLSYHVSGASWRSLYDLMLDGERLNVSYLAEVTQQTGEDWPEVALVLSTARAGQSQTLPELSPWYIGRPPPPRPPVGARPMSAMGGAAVSSGPDGPEGGPGGDPQDRSRAMAARGQRRPRAASMLAAEQAESESGAGLTYTVARPLAVPGDGGPHKTLVARFDADAVLDYLTVPVLAPEAYLRATVTNGTLLLLPGRARIFHGAQFVGETQLDTVAPGEEFEVQLGVDDQIKVERKLRRRSTSKALLGGTRTIDIGYEITVENHRDRAATVSVHDHIPVSTDGDVKVRARETSPPPAETDDLGELTWNLVLAPRESAAIRHRFTVEHPPQVAVTGL
jgi:uncharacterized protein (TIGR02231 family)